MSNIILISGKQGSGKTTLSDAIRKDMNRIGFSSCQILKFADPLYVLHEYLLNKMETFTGKPRVKKDGPLLQILGTEWGRSTFGPNVWCDILKKKIESISKNTLVIIDDCRFENEFEAFPEALRVRLTCSETTRKLRTESWRDKTNHPSETGLDYYEEINYFDLVLNTDTDSSIDGCVSLIFSELQRKSFLEQKR